MPNGWRDDPKVFIAIAPDGTVTVTCHRAEMGQGVRTSIADGGRRRAGSRLGQGARRPGLGDEARFGNQDTDGSRSLRHFFVPMRHAGAAARTMLEQAAANQWRVPVAEVRRGEPRRHPRRRRAARSATANSPRPRPNCRCPRAKRCRLKDPSAFRYIGKDDDRPHRQPRHHHRQGDLRHRRARRRHALRRGRPPAGLRRQGRGAWTAPRR